MSRNNVDGRGHEPSLSGPATSVQATSGRPPVQPASVTITDPLRQHFYRASSSSNGPPNLIVNWVNRLEKLNASLDETGASEAQHRHTTLASSTQLASTTTTTGRKHQSIVTIAGSEQQEDDDGQDDDDGDDPSRSDLCFKAAQLATELLLMLFAASLLVIASIVIFSKKIPDFMQSYEIVPKLLFFTCLVVAGYSFLAWSVRKMNAKCRGGGGVNGGDKDREKEKSRPEVAQRTLDSGRAAGGDPAAAAVTEVNRRLSLNSSTSKEGARKRSSLQEPLLAHCSPVAESHNRPQLDRPTLGSPTTSPPTRKVAFDASPHLLGSEQPARGVTIDEESGQEDDGEELEQMSRASV